jgi:Dolichyl-phosphate-mannose-protein mannosyltransferase
MAVVLLLLGGALLVVTALLGAAALRPESVVAFTLATYVLAWAEIVGLTEVLSLFRGVGTAGYLGGEAIVLVAAAAVWLRIGRPMPGVARLSIRSAVRTDPIVVGLGIVVGLAFVYEAVVGLTTPATNIDELWYHLARAAAWLHHGGLYQIPGGNAAENDYPPNAEIGVLYGFAFLHRDTFACIPQLVAQASLVVVIFGLARRIGSSVAGALFAGLLMLTLSDVALEAMTALNDIVVASFAGAAAYFVVAGKSPAHLGLAGVAVGLALGTKYTAFFALPVLVLLALAMLRPRRLAALVACTIVGFAAFGAYGYAENVTHSHTLLGGSAQEIGTAPASITARGTISTMARNTYRFVDLSGYRVQTRWLDPIATLGKDVFRALHIPTAPPEASTGGSPFVFDVNVYSGPGTSWYGPLGVLLVIPLSIVFAVRWALRKASRVEGLLALSLPLYLLVTALAYRYTSQGRFFITPILLTLPLAAVLYRRRRLAALVAAVAAVTFLFALAYDLEKPTGLAGTTAIWHLDRPAAQSLVFGTGVAGLIRAVDRLPAAEDIGVDAKQVYFGYALYGPTLRRGLVPLGGRDPVAGAERLGLHAIYVGSDVPVATAPAWIAERFVGAGTLLVRRSARRSTASATRQRSRASTSQICVGASPSSCR